MAKQKSQWLYNVFGLLISANLKIPGLTPVTTDRSADVFLIMSGVDVDHSTTCSGTLLYASAGRTERDMPFLTAWKQPGNDDAHVQLCHNNDHGQATFVIDVHGTTIRVNWTDGILFNDTVAYLLGPVMGFVLRLRGFTCLHAGVVSFGNTAVAILGPKGSGKTTLVSFLAHHGHSVLADDIALIVEIDGLFQVVPGYPRLRLWPETIALYSSLSTDELPRVLSMMEKRYIDLSLNDSETEWRFQPNPMPLGAVYVLEQEGHGLLLSHKPIRPAAGVATLANHGYPEYFLDRKMRARDFEILGRLCASVPVRHVARPKGLDYLPEFYKTMLDEISG